jgi:uncharacterized protein
MNLSRRHFFRSAAAVAVGFASLRQLTGCEKASSEVSDKSSGPKDMFALPPGFVAKPISVVGREMSDRLFTPGKHDGMAAFPGPGGRTLLVCNHELDADDLVAGPYGKSNQLLKNVDAGRFYDFGSGKRPAVGGTTTLLYNTRTQTVEREHLSLTGTLRNCAGGPTAWGSWITCEETVQARDGDFEQDHGYNFEVPAAATELCAAAPLKAMGRFNHEAVALHPRTGIVYQTEDRADGLIYRFVPRRAPQEAGDLLKTGGRLQALKVRDAKSLDTRNWRQVRVRPGQRLAVEWVDIENVESPEDDLRLQGFYGRGAARFARGEGMWYGRGAVYWCCTNGGKKQKGQVWRYTPSRNEGLAEEDRSPGTLELFVEPEDGNVAENGDNLTVSPWGDVFVCEDNGRGHNKLLRVTQTGKIIEFARNIVNSSELAGVTFSPDETTLFVNIQFPGTTLAITGPWKSLQDTLLNET